MISLLTLGLSSFVYSPKALLTIKLFEDRKGYPLPTYLKLRVL